MRRWQLTIGALLCAVVMSGCAAKAGGSVSSASSLVAQGMDKITEGDYSLALELFESAIQTDSEVASAYRGRGIALFHQNNIIAAEEAFFKAMELYGQNYGAEQLDTMKYYADCLYKLGRFEESVANYDILLDKTSGDQAYLYFMRGSAYVKLHNENQAVIDYEKALKGNENNYDMCDSMFECFMSEGYEERARSYLMRLLNGSSDDKLYIGKIYYRLGEYEKAQDYLKTAYNTGVTEAVYYLALCMEATGQAGITDLYVRHMDKFPEDCMVYNQYASYLINSGNYSKALEIIEQGLKVGGENIASDVRAGLMYNEGVCNEFLGNFAKAREIFKEYVELYPNDANAYREYQFLLSR